jgi:hypothetical protein
MLPIAMWFCSSAPLVFSHHSSLSYLRKISRMANLYSFFSIHREPKTALRKKKSLKKNVGLHHLSPLNLPTDGIKIQFPWSSHKIYTIYLQCNASVISLTSSVTSFIFSCWAHMSSCIFSSILSWLLSGSLHLFSFCFECYYAKISA